MPTLILLRHGESTANAEDRFGGWLDVALTGAGIRQAARAGRLIRAHGAEPDVVYTSVLRRAIDTANLALDEAGRAWIPVHRSWRLNERHYGALQGRTRADAEAEFGRSQVAAWRRSYDAVPPVGPGTGSSGDDPRYVDLGAAAPRAESLADVAHRLLPIWHDAIAPDLRAGRRVLVVAHGNSLRVLIKHIEGLSGEEVFARDVPTGVPLYYSLYGDQDS